MVMLKHTIHDLNAKVVKFFNTEMLILLKGNECLNV